MRSLVPSLLALAATAAAQLKQEYDYIICGGGTAGLAVANRLSEANATVLVVEAGVNGTTAQWDYKTVPQTFAGGNTQNLPAGKTVGGTSQINGTLL